MNINRQILKLAIPSILAGITVPIVGMVDIAVAGHLSEGGGSAAFIGGITIGSMLFDLLYWNFGFLRAGTGGLTAQAYGGGDMSRCGTLLSRSVLVSLVFAAGILLLQWPFSKLAFLFIDCSPEVKDLALKYFRIRIWAAPATLSLMAFRGWFIGMQDSVSSMFVDLTVNVVNAAASVALTMGIGGWEGMGFDGIALGTVLAQYSGLALAMTLAAIKCRRITVSIYDRKRLKESLEGEELKSFFALNGDLFVRSLGFICIYIGFTVIAARYGDVLLASSTIMMKILMLFSFFVDGFAYAGQALTGKFIGMRDRRMVRMSVRSVFNWSIGIALTFVGLYWAGGDAMLRIMTSDSEVLDACSHFLPWLVLMPPLGCAAFTWDGIFEGATASGPVRNSMLTATVAFFGCWIVGSLWMEPAAGTDCGYDYAAIHLLMAAYFAHLLARTVYLSASYKKHILNRQGCYET